MRRDRFQQPTASTMKPSESTEMLIPGSTAQTSSTILVLPQSLKAVFSACMLVFPPTSRPLIRSVCLNVVWSSLMKVLFLILCGQILTTSRLGLSLQEVLAGYSDLVSRLSSITSTTLNSSQEHISSLWTGSSTGLETKT
jgi:hypothetical protein